jgi:hypothetical protein
VKKTAFIVLLFLLNIKHIEAQNVLKGIILDEVTNRPVPFCEIIYNNTKGTLTNEEGYFNLNIDNKLTKDDSIRIQNIAYHPKLISINKIDLKEEQKFCIQPKLYKIEAATIKTNKLKKVKKGIYKRKQRFAHNGSKGDKVALYISNKKKHTGFIKNIQYYIVKKGNNPTNKFRVHIYAVDSITNGPGKELLPESIFCNAKEGDEWVIIDILKYNIKYPPNGFFIGLEYLTNNRDDKNTYPYIEQNNVMLGYSMEKFRLDLGWQYYSKRACWEHEIDKKIDGIDCYTNNPMMATEILIQK